MLVLTVLLVGRGVDRQADRHWERMTARTAERIAELESRKAGRAAGPAAEPGDAWDAFDAAIARASSLPEDHDPALEVFAAGSASAADREAVVQLLAREPGILEDLRRGARRARAGYPYDWRRGVTMPLPGLLPARRAARMAACRARLLAEESEPREAAEVLLDLGAFADDLGVDGVLISEMIGLVVGGVAVQGLRDLVAKLAPEDLLDLAARIERLESGRPRAMDVLRNDVLGMGMAAEAGQDVLGPGAILASWRYCFSPRLAVAVGVNELYDIADEARSLDRLPWRDARRAAHELRVRVESSPNFVVAIAFPGLKSQETERAYLARLRLVRAALTWRATGQVPEIPDPFGDTIRWTESGGALHAWSAGTNGVDDGGSGDWELLGSDLVIEVPSR